MPLINNRLDLLRRQGLVLPPNLPSSGSYVSPLSNRPPPNPLANVGDANMLGPDTETDDVNSIMLKRKQQQDSVAGLNDMQRGFASATPLVAGGLGSANAPLSGLTSAKDYTDKLNDDSNLLRIKNNGNLNVKASYNQPTEYGRNPSDSNPSTPNWDTPGEIGGKNKAARLVESKMASDEQDKTDKSSLAWTKESRESMTANANAMHSNAETLKLLHPNYTFHTVNGRVTAVNPADPTKKIDLGDANLLSPDALEQKKQLEIWNQGAIGDREKDVAASKLDNKPAKVVSPQVYSSAHNQAVQEVASDPTNAGMYSDIINQPNLKSVHPAERNYSIKGVDEINTDPMKLRLYSDFLDKVSKRTNELTGVGNTGASNGDKELGSIWDDDLSGLTKPNYTVKKVVQ